MKRDPVCNCFLDKECAVTTKRDGETFFFCSEECKKQFLSSR